jgi:6,7-dimethyl-8-ribityllumazine synthase
MNNMPILLVEARYYDDIATAMLEQAIATCNAQQIPYEMATISGALEIPLLIAKASKTLRYAGYVALGCVIRGETSHYETVANESARGLMQIGISQQLAIGNGILTVENEEQAWARINGKVEKKAEAAVKACISIIRWSPHD